MNFLSTSLDDQIETARNFLLAGGGWSDDAFETGDSKALLEQTLKQQAAAAKEAADNRNSWLDAFYDVLFP